MLLSFTTLEMIVPEKTPLGKVTCIDVSRRIISELGLGLEASRPLCRSRLGRRRTYKIIQKPRATGSNQRLPVISQNEQIRDSTFDGSSTVQFRVQHFQSKVKHSQRKETADAERDTPQGRQVVGAGGREDYQEDGNGQRSTERQRQVCHQDEYGSAMFEGVFIRSFGRRCRGRWILSACPKANDPSRDGHHPKHAVNGHTMRCSRQDPSNHYHGRRDNNGGFTTYVITGQADHDLTQDFTDEEGIRDTRADRCGVLLLVLLFEDDVRHGHQVVLIPIADQRKPRTKDGEYIGQFLSLGGDLFRRGSRILGHDDSSWSSRGFGVILIENFSLARIGHFQ